ncbi:CRISPR-associated helicase Cas3' [Desulfoscipio sp. XC116]|uniref:CRISPR-associated helicase Cas3' n=1 Tax=Desulfoscipio sp. XC116 TaxID=3144975 RepID=UPI00325B620E
MYIARIREGDKRRQALKEHLLEAKRLAEFYGAKLGLKHVAGLAGMLHDLGKYSDEFQDYIRQAAFYPEAAGARKGRVDHSTAGGKLLFAMLHNNSCHEKLLTEIIGNAIISHHANLHDYISPSSESGYLKRVQDKDLPQYESIVDHFFQEVITKTEFSEYVAAALEELRRFIDKSPAQSFFLTKFIFSCLIDADRTDARRFDEQTSESELELEVEPYQPRSLFNSYYQKLIRHLAVLKEKKEAAEPINLLRAAMSEQCERFSEKPSGIYTLSIPTGGGKTLASLRYALKHAQEHGKQRIVYVVPFTTIIEQNAREVRDILHDNENILEHHSNVFEEEQGSGAEADEQYDLLTKKERLKLARDSWDSPVIFTTLVQFLNVFYAKGNRNTRRLHNLIHSVIIFDEVQKVPTKCVSLFNEALNFLKEKAHCSILLCTATQPTLEYVKKHRLLKALDGEIVPDLISVGKAFKRVEIIDKTDKPMTNEQLAAWLRADAQAWGSTLVVLNTKTVVKNLYKKLKGGPLPVYHLSTSMCAEHRQTRLTEIRELLKKGIPFICVTTQLIEAGVDISFKCVVRSLAGLDSIAQAAGRCNRHGEDELRYVYVVDHAEEKLSNLPEIETGKGIAANIFARFKKKADKYEGNLLSEKAMHEYFQVFYHKAEADLNYYIPAVDKDMTKLLFAQAAENSYITYYQKKTGRRFPLLLNGSYKTAADYFHVIEQKTTSVIVPYCAGKELIVALNSSERIEDLTKFFRKAQHYTVDLYSQGFNQLKRQGAIIEHLDGMIYELKENWYSNEYGVDLQGEGGMEFALM